MASETGTYPQKNVSHCVIIKLRWDGHLSDKEEWIGRGVGNEAESDGYRGEYSPQNPPVPIRHTRCCKRESMAGATPGIVTRENA